MFACGEHPALRHSRHSHSMESEARTMDYAHDHGYPIPAVDQVGKDGTELLMERIDGPLMITVMGRRLGHRPIRRHAGRIPARLHRIPAPSGRSTPPAAMVTSCCTST